MEMKDIPRVKPEDRKDPWYNAYASLFASAASRFSVDEMVNCAGTIGGECIKMADLAMHALVQGDKLIEKESPKPVKLKVSDNFPTKKQVPGVCYCCDVKYQYDARAWGAFCSKSCFDFYWEESGTGWG